MTTLNLTRPIFGFNLIQDLKNLGNIFGGFTTAQSAANDYERLSARSDAQLAADGLSRADIARAVFERHFA